MLAAALSSSGVFDIVDSAQVHDRATDIDFLGDVDRAGHDCRAAGVVNIVERDRELLGVAWIHRDVDGAAPGMTDICAINESFVENRRAELQDRSSVR